MFPQESRQPALALLLVILAFLGSVFAADVPGYVSATIDGQQYLVKDNRRPSLYTGNYGDCMGGSSIDVTRFDAAYYKDNMTVVFHLGGETALKNESIMMYIGVYAYGEARFDLTFNPCNANIYSACPLKAGTPIEASGIIPISDNDVAGIPPIALSIPDFEGQAILRIFSNSSETEIGCFSAVVTNGSSFSQPAWVGSILGIFTLIAVLSSFATAIYGDSVPRIRKHYAHSLSVSVVFAVWQHIYFSSALSMNWPSVLVAFWSNYAWAGGMIYSEGMQNTINSFIGSNKGNTTSVGAAGTGVANPGLGGGYDISKIYRRGIFPDALNVHSLLKGQKSNQFARHVEKRLSKRALLDASDGFDWYGDPVKPGIPLPGNYSGFAGTLAEENIPASNAFMTGFLWFLVLIVIIAFSVVAFKLLLEGMSRTKMMKGDRLTFFRAHYLGYTALAVFRTLFIGFFMIMFLTLFQFTYLASPAPVAVACIVFLLVLIGLGGLAGYACFYRIKFGRYTSEPDRLNIRKTTTLRFIPWYSFERNRKFPRSEHKNYAGSLPWWSMHAASDVKSIHDDEDYTKKFGWLASRFRRTRWWFFAPWLIYEFIRACFLAGASGKPLVQILGLLVVEVIAFIGTVALRPFEGQRLNIIVVYLLGFSKVATCALSIAFDTHWNLPRIAATVVGIVIIVIQGVLTIVVMIAIILGAITSYMSVMRNRETIRPARWIPIREKYFKHMDSKEKDNPQLVATGPAPEIAPPPVLEVVKGPYFSVNSFKRMAKIEDEDEEFVTEISGDNSTSQLLPGQQSREGINATPAGRSRSSSVRSQLSYSSLPHGARVHRASWSTADFQEHFTPNGRRTSSNSFVTSGGSRPASRTLPSINTRISSNEDIGRQPSPLSTSQSITPPGSPRSTLSPASSGSTVPTIDSLNLGRRHVRGRSSNSLGGPRPPLRTVLSEDEIQVIATPKTESGTSSESSK